MSQRHISIFLFIFFISFVYYIFLFGIETFNPFFTDWLWKGGVSAQNYFGWAFFKNEEWLFPPGKIESFNLSQPTSIGLTDAIPLWAFFFKCFQPFLPNTFQYTGYFLFSNILLLGIVAYYWAKRLTTHFYLQCFFILFIILSPPFLYRLHWNPALSSHWIILGALYTFLNPWQFKNWAFWAIIAALIHPYILAMVFTLILFHFISSPTPNLKKRFVQLIFIFILSFFTLYLTGYFVTGSSLDDLGFGSNQLNLISLFNGYIFHPPFLSYDFNFDSEEGLLYLGFGGIILFVFALFFYFKNLQTFKENPIFNNIYLILVVVLLSIYALASPIRLLNTELFSIFIYDYPPFKQIAGIFRATGRFGWPLFYVLNIFIFAVLFKTLKTKILIPLLSVCLIVQVVDLFPQYTEMHKQNITDVPQIQNYLKPIQNAKWQQITKPNANLILFPSRNIFSFEKDQRWHITWERYIPPAFYITYAAYQYQMRTNYAHSSRMNVDQWQELLFNHLNLLKQGKQMHNTLYIFFDEISPEELSSVVHPDLFKKIEIIDGYPFLPICTKSEKHCVENF